MITLAFIYGNVGRSLMTRFLTNFAPLAERFIAVRSAGNQPLDDTAEAFAAFPNVITYSYDNAPANEWPHVDDFAAARNLAFDKAFEHGTEWVMWADTDDVIEADSIETILRALDEHGAEFDMVKLPYLIPDQGIRLWRERLVKRGISRWESPVHEAMQVIDKSIRIKCLEVDAELVHRPDEKRESKSSNARNIRILEAIPEEKRTISHHYHLWQEHRANGDMELADKLTKDFLRRPGVGRTERWEAMVSLAITATELADAEKWFLLAHRECPERRDSLGELAHIALAQGRLKEGLALSRQMLANPMPADAPWNLRRKFYSWGGLHLHTMALRMTGQVNKADVMEFNHFTKHGRKISLLHASRGRPEQASRTRSLWLDRAADADAIEHLFALDLDDEDSQGLGRFRHVGCLPSGGCVGAWNLAARASAGEVVVQVSDDFEPPMHWDKLILERIGDTSKSAVLAVSDGSRTDNLLCMAILTRARLVEQGWLFHPAFMGVYSDNWFTDCAYKDGVVIEARDIIFKHHHPAFGKGEVDATYAAQNSTQAYRRGRVIYDRLHAGVRTWPEVKGWCNFAPLYERVAHNLQDGDTFVEVGSWMGQSIICLAQKLQELGKKVGLASVDTWEGEKNQPAHLATVAEHGGSILGAFEDNVRAAGVHISPIIGDSAESAAIFEDGSLAGVFIDAAHDYASVVRDIKAWQPKVRPGGFLGGHDYHHEEVIRAVKDCGIKASTFGNCWVRFGNAEVSDRRAHGNENTTGANGGSLH